MDGIERTRFGEMPDGRAVDAIALRHAGGLRARILTYGATLAALDVPCRDGGHRSVVLGLPTLGAYRRAGYIGAAIGRYANRIRNGRFTLDGIEHHVSVNQPPNALHGGAHGFDKAVWRIEAFDAGAVPAVALGHVSPDGDQGFPGRMEVTIRYAVEVDALRIDYVATSDRPTVVNLTNHAYFNLAGATGGDILGHELTIDADRFTPVDATLIPTGEMRPVAGTPFDFRAPAAIGARIAADDEQLRRAGGYDHNFVLMHAGSARPAFAARVREPGSGLVMEVWTTEPGVQFYSGNFLDGSPGRPFAHRQGLCLETQHFPDSPNQPGFPSTVLRPGTGLKSTTLLRFPGLSAEVESQL